MRFKKCIIIIIIIIIIRKVFIIKFQPYFIKKSSHEQNVPKQKVVSNSFPWIRYREPKTRFRKFLKSPGLHRYSMRRKDKIVK